MKTIKILFGILIAISIYACSGDDNDEFKPIIAEDVAFFEDGEVEMLFDNAGPDGITMVFIGDGYVKEDLGKSFGSYRKDAERYFETLFNTEPFAGYQEHFNAMIIYAESQSRTIPEGEENADSTALKTYTITTSNNFSRFSSDPLRINFYKNKIPVNYRNNTNTLIVINDRSGGNACFRCDVGYSGSNSEGTMVHEVGHSFAGLGDEYEINNNTNPTNTSIRENLDITDNLDNIKWKRFIGLPGYENVGAYEGGGLVSFGVWRPEINSIMRQSSTNLQFNAPSREAIVKRIYEIREIPYDFETFLVNDVVTRQAIPIFNKTKNIHSLVGCSH
ncbi:M64 family metallopeptidase [uncultured Dokdonia sp.]|uniref:M64 family metallopeptidase n=1 Tax=uncultured Dokdonia sp. TaxID=575653 RepID=UPI00260D4D8A|nr:M64 family metallopeptidase [uncultured Dokdonia sp.]